MKMKIRKMKMKIRKMKMKMEMKMRCVNFMCGVKRKLK
jgi:hypothetical protein